MSQRPYHTAPIQTDRMPPGIPFIIGNEAAERFCFYGLRAILVVYNQHLLSRAFGWFYFSVNFGSTFSILLIPWLLEHYSARVAFGVPAVLMFLAVIVFWSGRYRFAHIPPGGKTFLRDTFNREGFGALFVFVAKAYKEKTYLQGAAAPAAA